MPGRKDPTDAREHLRLMRSHEMAVLGDYLFVDAGSYYNDLSNSSTASSLPKNVNSTGWIPNSNLYAIDLTDSLSSLSYASLHDRITPHSKNSKPNVTSGALVTDVSGSYVFHMAGLNNPSIAPGHFWQYDLGTNLFHAFLQAPNSTIQAYDGAATASQSTNHAYYHGGIQFNGIVSDALRVIDMDTGVGNMLPESDPVSGSTLVWLPYGDEGILVSIGGTDGKGNGRTMESVSIFDIEGGKWYTQNTTAGGSDGLPNARKRFCAVTPRYYTPDGKKANDKSFEIVIRGGTAVGSSDGTYDDVWALSLPSFSWIRYYAGSKGSNPAQFEYNQTCALVHDTYMTWLETAPDDDATLLGFFDITNPQSYTPSSQKSKSKRASGSSSVYDSSKKTYSVPLITQAAIKGKASPAAGWADGLDTVFSKRVGNSSSGQNTPAKRSHLSPGVLAGVIISSLLIIILLIFGTRWFLRFLKKLRRRAKRCTFPALPPPPKQWVSDSNYQEIGGQSVSELESSEGSPSKTAYAEPMYMAPMELPATPIRAHKP